MEKLKTSTLLEQLVYNSQVAMIGEDKRLVNALNDYYCKDGKVDANTPVTLGMLGKTIKMKDENYRVIVIKTLLKVLVDNELIESDIDFMNDDIFNQALKDGVEKACNDCKK